MNRGINCIYSKLSTGFGSLKQKPRLQAALGVFVGLAVTVSALSIYIDKNMVYAVKVKDKTIGYVKDVKTYDDAINSIKNSDGSVPLQYITAQRVQDTTHRYLAGSEVEKIAREELKLKMPAVIMYADDIEIARVQSTDVVNQVVEGLKKYYLSHLDYKNFTLISANIKENITTREALVNPGDVLETNDAIQKIVDGRGLKKEYKVVKGDTIWGIALKNDTTVEEIQAANPNVNLDKINIGDVIRLSINEPYLNLQLVGNAKTSEQIPFTTKNEYDKKMAKGTSKVLQKGQVGIADVERKVSLLNDQVLSEDVISNKVIQKPVEQVVVMGTKAPVYVATNSTGRFSWPARGIITSRFGRRSSGFHTGLDIAVPRGTPVHASDSGVVSFAGWKNGYGYCVMINHSNGYQTLYGHASRLVVHAGQKIGKGQLIAYSGSTGNSTGPHVHFEVRKNGSPQNPLGYLR